MKRLSIIFFIVLIILFAIPKITLASRVVILDLCGLTYEKIHELKLNNIIDTIENGAAGLMNSNTAGARNLKNGFLTIGSGKITSYHGKGNGFLSYEFVNGEKAKNIFLRRTGIKVPDNSIVVLDLQYAKNKMGDKSIKWGTLGDVLNSSNLKAALLGNWDIRDNYGRSSALMIMDSNGIIDLGQIDKTTTKNSKGTLDIDTDYDVLLKKLKELLVKAHLIFIEPGDLRRLAEVRDNISPQIYKIHYHKYASLLDKFVGSIKKILPRDCLFILLNPVPSKESILDKKLMAPLVLWQHNIKKGLLTSNTTRRKGIVSNLDVMPTILNHLKVPIPKDTIGKVMFVEPEDQNLSFLLQLNKRLVFTYKARPPLVKGYVFSQVVTVFLSLYLLLFRPAKIILLKPLLLGVLAGPLVLLIAGVLPPYSIKFSATLVFFFIVLTVYLSLLFQRKTGIEAFVLVAGLTSIIITIDLFMGANLMKISTLGYDPMAGARYYGIGNEFMGVLIGSSVIFSGFLAEKFNHRNRIYITIITFYYIFILFLMGSPQYGINVGGTITATATFGLMLLQLSNIKVNFKKAGLLATATISVVVLMALLSLNGEKAVATHLGRATRLIIDGDLITLANIVIRKLLMNIKLIKYTIWSRAFLLGLIVLAVIFYKPMGMVKSLTKKFPYLTSSFVGILTGSFIALLCNDSGIVAAATMMIYAVAPLIHITGQQLKNF